MAELNEGIANIEPGSALDILYSRLVAGFRAAQNESFPDFTGPDYVTTVPDETTGSINYVVDSDKINEYVSNYKDITIQNSAYLLADSIIKSVAGGGSGGEGSGLFVSIKGDSMTGKLNTLYGFASGLNGETIAEVLQIGDDKRNAFKVTGELHVVPGTVYLGNNKALSYDAGRLLISGETIKLDGAVECTRSITVGAISVTSDKITINDNEFYHSGNANLATVDWTMRNATVSKMLSVQGAANFAGTVTAISGVVLGAQNQPVLTISEPNKASLTGTLDVSSQIMLAGTPVLYKKNDQTIVLSAADKILGMGEGARSIVMLSDIYDSGNEYKLISRYGDGYFPNSLRAGHALGPLLLETYKTDAGESGVLFGKYVRLHSTGGPGVTCNDGKTLEWNMPFSYIESTEGMNPIEVTKYYNALFGIQKSTSQYAPQDHVSASVLYDTDADFFVFGKPVEAKNSIGIAESKTLLSDRRLFFDDFAYWLAIEDGVKYYGNAYMANDIGSVSYSSGFAGNGWKISKNQLTGNVGATFDELTIRKKMRVFEFEVQKQSFTNGAMWITDYCSGDIVEELI